MGHRDILAAAAAALGILAGAALGAAPAIAIVGVTVIHPERDGDAAIARDQAVVVEGTRIKSIGPASSFRLVILDADPLADVQNLSRIYRVVKDGHVYDPHALMRSIGGDAAR